MADSGVCWWHMCRVIAVGGRCVVTFVVMDDGVVASANWEIWGTGQPSLSNRAGRAYPCQY